MGDILRFLWAAALFFSISVFSLVSDAALRNPCHPRKAELVELTQGENEINLCLFGEALVGAETLQKASEKNSPDAVKAFQKGQRERVSGGVCGSFGAELVEAKDSKGNQYNLCRFPDGSVMEETTLWLGPDSLLGEKLGRILRRISES